MVAPRAVIAARAFPIGVGASDRLSTASTPDQTTRQADRTSSISSTNLTARTLAIRSSHGTIWAPGENRAAARMKPGEQVSTPMRRAVLRPPMAAIEEAMISGFHVSGYRSSNGTCSGIPASQLDSR